MKLHVLTLRARDQEEAFRFYTEKLGFLKKADRQMGPKNRWLTVAPDENAEVEIVIQPADWFEGEARAFHLGQVGKNPPMVLDVRDIQEIFNTLKSRGVEFTQEPTDKGYGIEALANDLYGNPLVFLQRKQMG